MDEEISIKTARLAIEKGFNPITDETKVLTEKVGQSIVITGHTLPTQTSLQRWLREKHGIIVTVDIDDGGKYFLTITRLGIGVFGEHDTWEIALEIGLEEGLKLI